MTKFEQFYREALRDLKKLIQRFPLAMLAAVASVVLGIIGIEIEQSGKEVPLGLMYTLMSLVLTFPMFVLAELISESLNWDVTKKYLLKLVPILIGVVYFFSLMLPYQEISERQGIEFFLLNVIFYFLILVAPFINNNFRSKLWNNFVCLYSKNYFHICLAEGRCCPVGHGLWNWRICNFCPSKTFNNAC